MAYYDKTRTQVQKILHANEYGLDSAEAAKRLAKNGRNKLRSTKPRSLFIIFISQFKDFIIYILLFAIFFSLLIGEYVDSVIILAILTLNSLIGFFQELSANRSLEALKKLSRTQATVLRDTNRQIIDAEELVIGDIIFLESGDKIPADARILTSNQLQLEESALTGESVPTAKTHSTINSNVQVGDQSNMAFATTTIVAGTGTAMVTATGMDTEIGKISQLIHDAETTETPLQKRLDRFGRRLGIVIICICVLVLLVLSGREYLSGAPFSPALFLSLAFVAISLAVAAVPTALPAVVTISLAVGVKRLLAKRSLVRRLASVETLGSCTVICSDKTGTLTQNQMTVMHGWSLRGESHFTGTGYNPQGEMSGAKEDLLYLAGLYCNNAELYQKENEWKTLGDPTEVALLVSGAKAQYEWPGKRVNELPFDSERKCMSVLVSDSENNLTVYAKGAPDSLLGKCTRIVSGNEVIPLSQDIRDQVLKTNDDYARKAMRVLGFAWKSVSHKEEHKEDNLIFIGLQAMVDPPRPDVTSSIKRAQKANIRAIMITGDYQHTAKAVAESIGIKGKTLTGTDLDRMDDEALQQALQNDSNIFARVIPEHKQRIVKALQRLGNVVAMTGDGVNDAPALKHADIGIAVGSGTEVAKEAADFVLLDDSFSHIVDAVEEGRGIYDNIQKSIMLLLSGNLGEVLIIFLAVITGMNLPLTAVLLLWINMITDGAPALAYSIDPYSKRIMERPPIPIAEGILPRHRLSLIVFLGVCGTLIGLFLFSISGGNSDQPDQIMHGRTMIFNFVVLYEMILVFLIRRDYQVPLFSNILLWLAVCLTIFLQALLMYTPLASVFQIVPLDIKDIALLVVGGIAFFLCYLAYAKVQYKGKN
jgi:Ca2+-transporting ATPase